MAQNINKDAVYRAAKPKDKDYFINDGGGLYLFVKMTGSKLWRFVYTFEGNQKRISLGIYPNITLESARRKSEEARNNIANGIDPGEIKTQAKKAKQLEKLNGSRVSQGLPIINSFADVAKQWLASIEHLTTSTTLIKKTSWLERLAFPVLGDRPINEIKSSDILAALKPLIDKSQLETAHRLHSEITSIFAYAIVHNFTDFNFHIWRFLDCIYRYNKIL